MAYERIRKKPYWPTWQHVAFVDLWEGVLLAHDIEPAEYRYDDDDLEFAATRISPDMDKWASVQRRLQVAIRNVCPNGRLDNSPYYGDAHSKVPLRQFACWAKNVVYWDDTPAELAQLAEPEQQSVPVGRWPWGDYETKPLGVLAEAVHHFWSTFDHDDPETAPTQADVVKFIKKRLTEVGYAKPDAIASAMATIIRHEKAPVGRRRKVRR